MMTNKLLNYDDQMFYVVCPIDEPFIYLHPMSRINLPDYFFEDVGVDVRPNYVRIAEWVWEGWVCDADFEVIELEDK